MKVTLAPTGTPLAIFQRERTDAIDEMFDNEGDNGIYPTGQFFARLDKCFSEGLADERERCAKALRMMLNPYTEGLQHDGYARACIDAEHVIREGEK